MGLILCESLGVRNPLHIDVLSLDIYSFEELCYLIFENPILVTEGIVNDSLIDFIDKELNMSDLAENIRRKRSNGVSDEDILIYIIDSSDLYNNAESILFRNAVGKIKKMTSWQVGKQRADYMFCIGKHDLAKKYYLEIIEADIDTEDNFIGSVYHNLGVLYANLFLYDEAYDAFKRSYELTNDEFVLAELYFLKKIFDPSDMIKKDEEIDALLRSDLMEEARRSFEIALDCVGESERLKDVHAIFQVGDAAEKRKLINDRIAKLKEDYRNME